MSLFKKIAACSPVFPLSPCSASPLPRASRRIPLVTNPAIGRGPAKHPHHADGRDRCTGAYGEIRTATMTAQAEVAAAPAPAEPVAQGPKLAGTRAGGRCARTRARARPHGAMAPLPNPSRRRWQARADRN